MAGRKAARKDQAEAGDRTPDVVEQKVVALAEHLGSFLGTVRAKADGWLDPEVLREQVGRIRERASDVLDHVNHASPLARQAGEKPAVTSTIRASRGPVDAPGKRHRKPPPQERVAKRMGEATGKQMGQKSVKNAMHRGRG
jgi:hypothetical protein